MALGGRVLGPGQVVGGYCKNSASLSYYLGEVLLHCHRNGRSAVIDVFDYRLTKFTLLNYDA